jgi:hypothetical protein
MVDRRTHMQQTQLARKVSLPVFLAGLVLAVAVGYLLGNSHKSESKANPDAIAQQWSGEILITHTNPDGSVSFYRFRPYAVTVNGEPLQLDAMPPIDQIYLIQIPGQGISIGAVVEIRGPKL